MQRVARLFDEEAARAFDLEPDRVTVLIHSGSRGLGHQVCTDFVKRMDAALGRHGITLPDRPLSCAPASSAEGRQYLAAMAAAANFAWANRHVLAQRVREAIRQVLGEEAAVGTVQVYDVAHNVAKRERHGDRELLVHRKGATRAFPPGHPDIPAAHRDAGPAVFIPARWARRRSCSPAAPAPWSAHSPPCAMAPGARSAHGRPPAHPRHRAAA